METLKNLSEKIIRTSGLKKTNPRLLLVEALLKANKPISANELFKLLAQNKTDKVTVYRTLENLAEKGVVKRVHTGEREMKYEITKESDDHHHVICLKCKKVADFTGCNADTLIKKALTQVKGFRSVSHHTFDIFGLCDKCAK